MRLFGSDRIARLMDRMGVEEGEVIQHSMITKSIERAQKKVEENNFGIRKRLLEYDDIMNAQREVIYKKRRHALFGERLGVDIANMIYDICESISSEYRDMKDFDGFKMELLRVLSLGSPVDESTFDDIPVQELTEQVYTAALKHYQEKSEMVARSAMPVIQNVYDTQREMYQNIVVPFTDGIRTLQIVANLEKCVQSEGKELIRAFEKNVILAMIDNSWKEHLREMDDLKQSVQGAVYEQKDPLLIYKFEAFELFKQMMDRVNKEIGSFLIKSGLPVREGEQQSIATAKQPTQEKQDLSKLQTSKSEVTSLTGGGNPGQAPQGNPAEPEKKKVQPVRVEKKVGRNEPCPCGSGKKYKQCHGKAKTMA
jgi:preprotein translocase subunit SecA